MQIPFSVPPGRPRSGSATATTSRRPAAEQHPRHRRLRAAASATPSTAPPSSAGGAAARSRTWRSRSTASRRRRSTGPRDTARRSCMRTRPAPTRPGRSRPAPGRPSSAWLRSSAHPTIPTGSTGASASRRAPRPAGRRPSVLEGAVQLERRRDRLRLVLRRRPRPRRGGAGQLADVDVVRLRLRAARRRVAPGSTSSGSSTTTTTSTAGEIGRYQPDYPGKLIIPGTEVTTYKGHYNNIGSSSFADFRGGPVYRCEVRRDLEKVTDGIAPADAVRPDPGDRRLDADQPPDGDRRVDLPWLSLGLHRRRDRLLEGRRDRGPKRRRRLRPAPEPVIPSPFTATAIAFYERALASGRPHRRGRLQRRPPDQRARRDDRPGDDGRRRRRPLARARSSRASATTAPT